MLLHALEDKGIYVSSGSACSSNHPGVSGTLKGIGVKGELLDATLRFSFGMFNTCLLYTSITVTGVNGVKRKIHVRSPFVVKKDQTSQSDPSLCLRAMGAL